MSMPLYEFCFFFLVLQKILYTDQIAVQIICTFQKAMRLFNLLAPIRSLPGRVVEEIRARAAWTLELRPRVGAVVMVEMRSQG
jgi:hypothetical protein